MNINPNYITAGTKESVDLKSSVKIVNQLTSIFLKTQSTRELQGSLQSGKLVTLEDACQQGFDLLEIFIKGNLSSKIDPKNFWKICTLSTSPEVSLVMDRDQMVDIITWGALNLPLKSSITALQWLFQSICSDMQTEQVEKKVYIDLVKSLDRNNLLPTLILFWVNNNTSSLDFLLKIEGMPLTDKLLQIKKTYGEECQALNGLLKKRNKFENIQLINVHIQNLKRKNFPFLSFYKPGLKVLNAQIKDFDALKKKGAFTKELHDFSYERRDVDYLVKEAASKYRPSELVNKAIFHLILDKMAMLNEEYSGFYVSASSSILREVISNISLNDLELSKPEVLSIENTLKNIHSSLNDFILFDALDVSLFGSKLVQRFEQMKEGQTVFFPTGSIAHALSVLVSCNSDGLFQMKIFNTGRGVLKWHSKWGNTNRFQTYLEIDRIPKEDLLDEKTWDLIASNRRINSAINPFYEIVINQLAKRGVVQKPSLNPEDYEARQTSGTCSMQSLLAFFRHQIVQQAPYVLPKEREGLYKILKANMLSKYYKSNIKLLDQTIHSYSRTVMDKFGGELALYEAAKKQKSYLQTVQEIINAVHDPALKEPICLLVQKQALTVMERFSTLREAETLLSDLEKKHPNKVFLDSPGLGFALAKKKHHAAIEAGLKSLPDKVKMANIALSATAFPMVGIEVVGELSQEDVKKLLVVLNEYRDHNGPMVERIMEYLRANHNTELALFVKKNWDDLDRPKNSLNL